ncbi:MAG TPA: galactitol-1-phosphate 5-dehydrogenase [Bryobacteraceae bacterium]|nr:galactitol-1-phosphate 5-dehydrogenase [Bryobacteraceae bacterium]
MRALLLKEYRQMELVESDRPPAGAGEVLIRVAACGICGSDVHGFDGSTGRRIPPLIMGHEAAGVVEHAAPDVAGFEPGDRVTFDSTVYCGECFFCQRGRVNLCDNRRVLGVSCADYRRHGAFAEYVSVPARIVYHLPDQLSFEHAAMIEAVSVAVHAVGLTPVRLGDTAAVFGAGMIGQIAIQALKLAGCSRVIALDPDQSRLALAGRLGAAELLNPNEVDAPAAVRDLTAGRGSDIALEAVGSSQPFQAAVASVRKGGVVTLVGNIAPTVEMPLQSVVTREIRLIGSCASAGEYPACIDLLARGSINVEPLISAVAPLSDGPAWFTRLYAREPGLMKVILRP